MVKRHDTDCENEISGWLTVLAIGLVYSAITGLISASSIADSFSDEKVLEIFYDFPAMYVLLRVEVFVLAALSIFELWVVILLVQRDRRFPTTCFVLLLSVILYEVLDTAAALFILSDSPYEALVTPASPLVLAILLICLVYLKRSTQISKVFGTSLWR